jgi:hypothetical protein
MFPITLDPVVKAAAGWVVGVRYLRKRLVVLSASSFDGYSTPS